MKDIYVTTTKSSTSFTSDIETVSFAEDVQVFRPSKTYPSFLGRVSNLVLAVAAFTSPQVYIPETPDLRRSVSAPVRWGLPRRGGRISVKRARELALQALAETERNLQRERHAEVALMLCAWENNDLIEV